MQLCLRATIWRVQRPSHAFAHFAHIQTTTAVPQAGKAAPSHLFPKPPWQQIHAPSPLVGWICLQRGQELCKVMSRQPQRWHGSCNPKDDVRQCCILVAVKANHRLCEPEHRQQQEESDYSPAAGTQEAASRPPCLVLVLSHGQLRASLEAAAWAAGTLVAREKAGRAGQICPGEESNEGTAYYCFYPLNECLEWGQALLWCALQQGGLQRTFVCLHVFLAQFSPCNSSTSHRGHPIGASSTVPH